MVPVANRNHLRLGSQSSAVVPEIIATSLSGLAQANCNWHIKAAPRIAIMEAVPMLIAPEGRRAGHENDRFDACWWNTPEPSWQVRILGIEPSKGIYGQAGA